MNTRTLTIDMDVGLSSHDRRESGEFEVEVPEHLTGDDLDEHLRKEYWDDFAFGLVDGGVTIVKDSRAPVAVTRGPES